MAALAHAGLCFHVADSTLQQKQRCASQPRREPSPKGLKISFIHFEPYQQFFRELQRTVRSPSPPPVKSNYSIFVYLLNVLIFFLSIVLRVAHNNLDTIKNNAI